MTHEVTEWCFQRNKQSKILVSTLWLLDSDMIADTSCQSVVVHWFQFISFWSCVTVIVCLVVFSAFATWFCMFSYLAVFFSRHAAHMLPNWWRCFIHLLVFRRFGCVFLSYSALRSQEHSAAQLRSAFTQLHFEWFHFSRTLLSAQRAHCTSREAEEQSSLQYERPCRPAGVSPPQTLNINNRTKWKLSESPVD